MSRWILLFIITLTWSLDESTYATQDVEQWLTQRNEAKSQIETAKIFGNTQTPNLTATVVWCKVCGLITHVQKNTGSWNELKYIDPRLPDIPDYRTSDILYLSCPQCGASLFMEQEGHVYYLTNKGWVMDDIDYNKVYGIN